MKKVNFIDEKIKNPVNSTSKKSFLKKEDGEN